MNPVAETTNGVLAAVDRLTSDIKKAAINLSRDEARFLVDAYYAMQEDRIRSAAQVRELTANEEPHEVLTWLEAQSQVLEGQIKRALDSYSAAHPVGAWSREVIGIGPVIAAGLLAHIDITRCPTVGHIWSFAGLNPTVSWNKGEKRPWNAKLKTLCWKIGESFVKVSGNEDAVYGKLYLERKAKEIEKNDRGEFAEQAKAKLEKFKIGKDTDAYKAYSQGKLPPAHIHARAKRWAVKQFLSDWHLMAYREHFKQEPPLPYPIVHLGHAHLRKVA
jgi:hypothetical protein